MRQKSNNMKRKTKIRHSPVLILFALICVGIWLTGVYVISNNKQEPLLIDDFTAYINITAPVPSAQPNTPADNIHDVPLNKAFQTITYEELVKISNDYLLLVNSEFGIPKDITGELVKVLNYVKTLNTELTMNKDALIMLQAMFDSAANIGYNDFRVTDGYRTHECQTSLYDSSTDKSFVALPGHSEHQTGLAVDISYNGVNIENSKQGTWLADNSYKFGFILRYPQHKTDITGIIYEPWHFRYIGQMHAYYCYQNDFTLEEYIGYLKEQKEITVIFNGFEYIVYYLSGADDTIEIPDNYSYSVSLDNTGGIIVTTRGN